MYKSDYKQCCGEDNAWLSVIINKECMVRVTL